MRTHFSKALIVGSLFGGALFPLHSSAGAIGMESDPACPSANYATPPPVPPTAPYTAVAGYSCTIGDKTFSGFAYGSRAGTTALDPTTLPVTPTAPVPQVLPGFTFGGNWFAAAGASQSSIIVFTVTTTGALIDGLTLSSDVAPKVTGAGSATVVQMTCLNGSFSGPTGACSSGIIGVPRELSPTSDFDFTGLRDPIKSVGIMDTVTVSGGGTGTGSIPAFSTRVREVPEPSTGSLFVLALAGILLRRGTRRRLLR
jgi:hypothetical protein